MNYQQLRTEFINHGFQDLSPTRHDRFLNDTYQEICDLEAWPFLETTTSGNAPLTITDIRAVLSVIDTTSLAPLPWRDKRTVRELDPTLALTGSPECWYLDTATSLKVYPANTSDTISVFYLKIPTGLAAAADAPLIPTRYHSLIVEGAAIRAYREMGNEDAALAAQAWYDQRIEHMRNALLVNNYDTAADMSVFGSTDW